MEVKKIEVECSLNFMILNIYEELGFNIKERSLCEFYIITDFSLN